MHSFSRHRYSIPHSPTAPHPVRYTPTPHPVPGILVLLLSLSRRATPTTTRSMSHPHHHYLRAPMLSTIHFHYTSTKYTRYTHYSACTSPMFARRHFTIALWDYILALRRHLFCRYLLGCSSTTFPKSSSHDQLHLVMYVFYVCAV